MPIIPKVFNHTVVAGKGGECILLVIINMLIALFERFQYELIPLSYAQLMLEARGTVPVYHDLHSFDHPLPLARVLLNT